MLSTVANVSKTMLGTGILTLSWAYYFSTLWPGVLFTVVACGLACVTYVLLGVCSERTGERTYSGIWTRVYSEHRAWIPDAVIGFFCMMASTGYLIIVGDYVPKGLKGLGCDWAPLQSRRFAIAVMWLLLLPFSFMKDLSFLAPTSVLGTVAALYTTAVLVAEAADLDLGSGSGSLSYDWEPFRLQLELFVMIPTAIYAFTPHFNAPELYQQQARRSPRRWAAVTGIAFGLCLLVTLACGVSGYVMLGAELGGGGRSNVLDAPALQTKRGVMAAYLATTLSVALSVPLYSHAMRDAADGLWMRALPAAARRAGGRLGATSRRHLLSSASAAAPLGLSMALDDLGLVNAFAGAACATLFAFVFPVLMYLRCVEAPEVHSRAWTFVHRVVPVAVLVTGVFTGVCGVATTTMLAFGMDHVLLAHAA